MEREENFWETLRAGLGYESSTPLHFHINKEALQYISAEEVKDKQQSQSTPLRDRFIFISLSLQPNIFLPSLLLSLLS